ncbi:hypothetical protein [Rhodococcus sp. H29-C3]|uniref:hypothetical protein n=1 Tax=Rhodococcus sp. H29-C3 TaxID=3046307 RepID=UPI0032D58CE6
MQDLDNCVAAGAANAVVEIWHCDGGGIYSGFESGSTAAGIGGIGGIGAPPGGGTERPPEGGGMGGTPPGGGMGGAGATSDGWYSVVDSESATTDDGTYLRGHAVLGPCRLAEFERFDRRRKWSRHHDEEQRWIHRRGQPGRLVTRAADA